MKGKNILKIKSDTLYIFLSLFLFKFFIEFVYYFGISVNYGYDGLTQNINLYKYTISVIGSVLVFLITLTLKDRPSHYIVYTLILFIYMPLLSYYWLNDQSSNYILMVSFSFGLILLITRLNFNKILIKSDLSKIFYTIFIFYLLITFFLILLRGGIDPRAFNFDTIYELREENNITGILGYLLNWSAKALFPVFFLYFLFIKRNLFYAFIIFFMQIFLFLSFGNKAFLFSIGAVLLTSFIMKKKNYFRIMPLSLGFLVFSSYIIKIIGITDTIYRAIPYRMLFIPTQIQFQYYEFFVEKSKVLFAEGIIGKILNVENPYSIPIPIVISRYYLGRDTYANTGIFADAFYNGGFLAMIIISLILASILLLLDANTGSLPIYYVIGSLSYIIFVFNDTGLQTTLLTGGLGLQIILLVIVNSFIGYKTGDSS